MTGAGKLVGAVCAVFAIFTLILPIPIVVNSFASYYKNRLWRNEVAHRRAEKLAQHQFQLDQMKNGGGDAGSIESQRLIAK